MNDRKVHLEITVDSHLFAYAEHLVETGQAPSVSSVINQALEEKAARDRRRRRLWRDAAERADRAKVDRMRAYVDAQLAQLNA